MTDNPYDVEDTCQCSAWSEGECACGGYVDPSWKRIWQKGYDAATETPDAHMVETLRLRTAALHRVQRSNDQLRRECLDREATEADVRARLADAENALARVRGLAEDPCGCGDEYCRPGAWAAAIREALDAQP